MARSTNEISIEEVLRQLGRMSEDGTSSSSAYDAAVQNYLNSIANNSTASQTIGIPASTSSRGPIGSGLLTMSSAQEQQILNQRASDRGREILPGEDQEPTENPEESIFQILMDIMADTQGTIEGLDAETVNAIRSAIDSNAGAEQLRTIAQQILGAGGYEAWLEQQNQQGSIEGLIEELGADYDDQKIVDTVRNVVDNFKNQIPSNPQELRTFVENLFKSASGLSNECQDWTGPIDSDLPNFTDCVTLEWLQAIPGLDLNLPPGVGNMTLRDLINKVKEAGDSWDDFVQDPGGWLEEKVNDAVEKVNEVLGSITSGTIFTTSDLDDLLSRVLGGWISGVVLDRVKEKLEEENPLLFVGDCADENFRNDPANKELCSNYTVPPVTPVEGDDCTTQGPDGTEVAGKIDKDGKCIPLGDGDDDDDWVDDGFTKEDCDALFRTHIPGNAETQTKSECGGCLSGYSPSANSDNGCVQDPLDCTSKGKVYDEVTGGCVNPPPEFTENEPCVTEGREAGKYDSNGNCVANPVIRECPDSTFVQTEDGKCECPEGTALSTNGKTCISSDPIYTCSDPNAERNPEGGCGECKENFERKPGATRCTPIDPKPKPDGCLDGQERVGDECLPECPQGSTRGADGKCVPSGTTLEPEPTPNPCDNLEYKRANPTECGGFNGCPAGQDRVNDECVPACKEGERRQQGVCVPITSGTTPEPEPEPESGSGGGGGGGSGGMLDLSMGVAYQPGVFTGVEYRAPTQPIRALTALNNMIDQDVKKGLFSL